MTNSIYDLPVENMALYLQSVGWTLVCDNEVVYAFEGFQDADGAPLEIVLPKNESAPDYSNYVRNSIGMHSVLTEKAPDAIANEIKLYDHDVLKIGVVDNLVDNAAIQMPPIKRLIGHSANMERSLKPYFNQYYLEARKMLKHFEIHQSCNGNVSYHVESQVGEIEPYQKLLFRDREDPGKKFPLQRRVVERIATGLIDLNNSVRDRDPHALIAGYADGFNANMCNAILEISKHSPEPVAYSVNWSRKLPVTHDVSNVGTVQIERPHIEYLKQACDKLRERKTEFQRIEGRVIGLSSSVDPQSDDADKNERSIVVLRTDRKGSSRKLWINLGKDDYITAHKAHLDWATISVEGKAINRRAGWQLADPKDFKIQR